MKWTNEFSQIENKLGITRSLAEDAVLRPEVEQKILTPEYSIVLHMKKMNNEDQMIVIAWHNGKAFLVDYAFKISKSLVAVSDNSRPVDFLEKLADNYGLPITIGERTTKFLYDETILINHKSGFDLRQLRQEAKGRGFAVLFGYDVIQDTLPYVKCSLMFIIDKRKYLHSDRTN